jgi:hypothetical protein
MDGSPTTASRKIEPAGGHRLAPTLLIGLLALLCTVSRAGQVYKSVDAEGHVVYSDHADPAAPSSVVQLEDAGPPGPPGVMHFCWTNCFTLELDGGLYRRADGSDETWTVERFTPTSFLLHRHDAPAAWNGFSADVAYEGQISDQRLVNVTVGGRPVNDIQAAWGGALDTLPGSNAERDQRSPSPPATADSQSSDAPPPLPDEVQPPNSDDGFLWTPGYWGWAQGRYYWVPGAWLAPPRVGLFWTPGYWGFAGAAYVFHAGYWAPHIGYYGGINYGFGYAGVGYTGGRWVGNTFAYNSAVSRLNSSVVHNTYSEAPTVNAVVSKVSYNGGPGGITARPTVQERSAASEPHLPATPQQRQYAQQVATAPTLVARVAVSPSTVVTVHKTAASNAQRAATGSSVAGAAARTVSNDTPDPAPPRPKQTAARPAAPKSGAATMSSERPTH